MTTKTIKSTLTQMLQTLSKENFDYFCHQLRDRREKPKVRLCQVENKTRLEISDLLVSLFTEARSVAEAVELLRGIGCNEEAERLDSETKHLRDKGDPTFRRTSDGLLDTNPSPEAQSCAAPLGTLAPALQLPAVKSPAEVEAEAKALVLSEGGDLSNKRLILSRHIIQFGKYKGQTFKWLLENDVGYGAWLVANHQEQRGHSTCPINLMANKEALTRYLISSPDVLKEVRKQRAYIRSKENSLQPGQEGKALVGFGRFQSETLENLYNSGESEKISYVNFLRKQKLTCDPGSKMEDAIKYILNRDRKAAAARKRWTRQTKRF